MEIMKKSFLTTIATVVVLTFASLSNAGVSEIKSKIDTFDVSAGPQPLGAVDTCLGCFQP